ncbi:hypothetical protein D1007_32028 [Hordeum vulgare]|nr:hypothetical protein D1007_32028 [Hordeum vulgare]
MPSPPARLPGLAPPRLVATAPAAKPTKGRGGGKRAANRSRNPTDSSTQPVKLSKAVAAARGDESQPMRSAASSNSPTSIPQPPPPPPSAVEDDVARPTVTASNMFDEMSQSLDDRTMVHKAGGVRFVGNMTGMGRNEDASGGAHGNESSPLVENVDKEGGEDDDRTTVHKADGVDDPHD